MQSIKYNLVKAGWFLDRAFLNSVYSLRFLCLNCSDVWCSGLLTLFSNSVFNVHFFECNVECGAASCSKIVCVSALLFSADFRKPSLWPISSPFLYLPVLGSSLKACRFWLLFSISIPCRRPYNSSNGIFLQFTFSIENRVFNFKLIFRCFDICSAQLSYYLSQYLMNSYCLLAWFGVHHSGIYREITLGVFLSGVYPGDSCRSNFSGYASIFCTAA